jgi:hypothetical protein
MVNQLGFQSTNVLADCGANPLRAPAHLLPNEGQTLGPPLLLEEDGANQLLYLLLLGHGLRSLLCLA